MNTPILKLWYNVNKTNKKNKNVKIQKYSKIGSSKIRCLTYLTFLENVFTSKTV